MLKARKNVTCRVDGIAASIASVIAMAGSKVQMPKNAMLMMHDPSGMCGGNSEDMRRMADLLDQHADVIANVYCDRSGTPVDEMRDLMRQETWMNGQEAKDAGLCDDVTEEVAIAAKFDFTGFKHVPEAIANTAQKPSVARRVVAKPIEDTMRKKLIALLKKHGFQVADDITDEALTALADQLEARTATPPAAPQNPAAPTAPSAPQNGNSDATITALQNSLNTINAQLDRERKQRITNAVNQAVQESRIPANQAENWVRRAMADETVITDIQGMPPVLPGGEPVNVIVELTSEDPREIDKAVCNLFGKGIHNADTARERGLHRARIISNNLNRLMPVLNAGVNTVSADLKRTVILQQMIRAFAIRVLPLTAFSTVLNGVRLEGTDKVAVPYFALNTTASTDFVAANGYDTFGDTNSDAKTVTANKRKYQGLKWTSSELARQPFMDIGMGAMLMGEQLALDVVNDILSLVTVATFGASVKAEPSAAFDSDDVMDLKGVADIANWPAGGRSLLLNSAYDVNLLKDQAIKNAMAFGDNSPIREGRIVRLGGFDYYPDARIPSPAGENLEGFIAFKSGLLVGFAPVGPTEEVRAQLTRYEVVVEPTTGATFEYRLWGSADFDTSKQIIESNYGRSAGEAAAIKRITNQ
jgi:hypothetical protein